MAKTDFEYGTLITPEFLDLLFYKDHGSGRRGIQFDGQDEDGHLPQIITAFLADGAVDTAKLANASVANAKIQDGAVNTPKVADNAITESKIGDGAVSTRTLANGAVTGPKLGTEAVNGVNIASGAIVAPLKKTPNAQALVYLAFNPFCLDIDDESRLRLSNSVRQSIVTNPVQADSNDDVDTYFKEFSFGSLVNAGSWLGNSSNDTKWTTSVDTGLAFESHTIVLAMATAKTIVVSGFSFPKGVLVFSSSSPWPYFNNSNGVAVTPLANDVAGGEFADPVGRLYFTKHATNGNLVANLDIFAYNQIARRTMASYSFRLLLGYRQG